MSATLRVLQQIALVIIISRRTRFQLAVPAIGGDRRLATPPKCCVGKVDRAPILRRPEESQRVQELTGFGIGSDVCCSARFRHGALIAERRSSRHHKGVRKW